MVGLPPCLVKVKYGARCQPYFNESIGFAPILPPWQTWKHANLFTAWRKAIKLTRYVQNKIRAETCLQCFCRGSKSHVDSRGTSRCRGYFVLQPVCTVSRHPGAVLHHFRHP